MTKQVEITWAKRFNAFVFYTSCC